MHFCIAVIFLVCYTRVCSNSFEGKMHLNNIFKVFVFMAFLPFVADCSIPDVNYVKNADRLDEGKVKTELLHVGTDQATVAAGDDSRFETVKIGQPATTTASDRALIWIE